MTAAAPQRDWILRRRARAEASAWVARLHGPMRTPEVEAAFRHWLGASDENRLQFERVTQVWDDARGIPQGGVVRPIRRERSYGTRPWAVAAVILAAVGIVTLSVYRIWFAGVYRTGIGEQLLVHLEDGSRVLLNSNSRIKVHFTADRRHVIMGHGEAYFEVAGVPERRFIVSAGSHDVTALGTAFQVRYDAGDTAVTLVEGKVAVSNPDRGARGARAPAGGSSEGSTDGTQMVTLNPGERLLMVRNAAPKRDVPRLDVVTAWRRGEVVLEKTTLDEAVAEMNRYQGEQLVIGSPSVGKLRISGIYHIGDSADFARTVASLYRLQVTEKDNQIRLNASPAAAVESRP